MTSKFDGAYAKLDRVDDQMKALHQLLSAHVNGPGVVTGTVEFLPDADHRANLRSHLRAQALPRLVQVIVGEIAYNLRSALDHFVYQLVLANGGTPVDGPGGTQFPIRWRPSATVQVAGGVSQAAQQIIEVAQADHQQRSHGDALAVLAHVSNVDKHREPARGHHGVSGWVTWTGEDDPSKPWQANVTLGERSVDSVEVLVDPPDLVDGGGQAYYRIELETSPTESAPLYATLDTLVWQVRRLVNDLVGTVSTR